ncbi:hypothetical protein B0H14DRAFT_2585341 [Mycena olivaceomarginata]|nr:hypothetical protein B0H14DRAFT_2585341 [Mycena olivaceomarginata]
MTGKREGHSCCGLHSWSVDQIDTSQASTGKREVQGAPPVASYIQGVGGVGGRTVHLMEMELQEGGRHSENPLLQATLVSEVLEAEQPSSTGRQEVQGTPRRRPYLNYNGGNVLGIAGNKVGNGGQPQDTIYPDGDL